MMAEGYDLRSVMNTPGVKGEKTVSNHIIEVEDTLGIEAARSSIIDQVIFYFHSLFHSFPDVHSFLPPH